MVYSLLKLLIGFAIAAFIAWKLIVIKAISKAIPPASRNTHHWMFIRYAKSCNHLFMENHVSGNEISIAINTNFRNSIESIPVIAPGDAPKTFRIPISLTRILIMNAARPNSPKLAIITAIIAKEVKI